MSLHYSFSIAGPTQCEALATRLQRVPDYKYAAGGVVAPGFQVRISQPGPVDIMIIEEEFGFTPTARVTFRLDKEVEPVSVYALATGMHSAAA